MLYWRGTPSLPPYLLPGYTDPLLPWVYRAYHGLWTGYYGHTTGCGRVYSGHTPGSRRCVAGIPRVVGGVQRVTRAVGGVRCTPGSTRC